MCPVCQELNAQKALGDGAPDLQNWEDYYRWRNLPLDHPAAIVLSTVLTLFCAIRWCLRHLDCDSLPAELTIHLLGTVLPLHSTSHATMAVISVMQLLFRVQQTVLPVA